MEVQEKSNRYLLMRSLEPSFTSLVGCLIGAVAIITLHLVALGLNYGTVIPSVLSGQWATNYTNKFIHPIEKAINNPVLSNFINVFIWGLTGLVIYYIIAYFHKNYSNWRETEKNVQIVRGVAIQHPLQKTHLLRALWRVGIGIVFVLLIAAARPIFKFLFNIDNHLFAGHLKFTAVFNIIIAVVIWAVLLHVFLVLIRLYLFRTRLGTDLIY